MKIRGTCAWKMAGEARKSEGPLSDFRGLEIVENPFLRVEICDQPDKKKKKKAQNYKLWGEPTVGRRGEERRNWLISRQKRRRNVLRSAPAKKGFGGGKFTFWVPMVRDKTAPDQREIKKERTRGPTVRAEWKVLKGGH